MFKYLFTLVVLVVFSDYALAVDIPKPSFVDGDGKAVMTSAGATIMDYLAIAFGVMLAVVSASLGFMAFQGKMDEMWEKFKNIIIGVVMFLGAGTAIFSIL